MIRIVSILLLSIIAFSACQSDKQKGDTLFDKDIKVVRYDRLQYEASALNSFSALQKMNLEYPQATRLLIEDVLMIGNVSEPDINERLCAYYSDTILLQLMVDAESKFKDMEPIEQGLTEAFKTLKKEIPSFPIPVVYSQVSALNQSVVVGDSLLGFSIDKYLGEDYPLYERYYYSYQRRTMNPDRILPDCLTSYLYSLYPFPWLTEYRTLFDVIMYRGKIHWVVSRLLKKSKSYESFLGYTKEEILWCRKNKKILWDWMVNQGHLWSKDPMIIRAYTHPDPSMVFKGEKIPPLIGVWMGMELTDLYMQQHPNLTIEELLSRIDFRDIRNVKF